MKGYFAKWKQHLFKWKKHAKWKERIHSSLKYHGNIPHFLGPLPPSRTLFGTHHPVHCTINSQIFLLLCIFSSTKNLYLNIKIRNIIMIINVVFPFCVWQYFRESLAFWIYTHIYIYIFIHGHYPSITLKQQEKVDALDICR